MCPPWCANTGGRKRGADCLVRLGHRACLSARGTARRSSEGRGHCRSSPHQQRRQRREGLAHTCWAVSSPVAVRRIGRVHLVGSSAPPKHVNVASAQARRRHISNRALRCLAVPVGMDTGAASGGKDLAFVQRRDTGLRGHRHLGESQTQAERAPSQATRQAVDLGRRGGKELVVRTNRERSRRVCDNLRPSMPRCARKRAIVCAHPHTKNGSALRACAGAHWCVDVQCVSAWRTSEVSSVLRFAPLGSSV